MNIEQIPILDKIEKEFVVVIDVIRAFTTAAFAFKNGAKKIILVKEIEDALDLKRKNRDFLLIGEKGGSLFPGFDLPNSPSRISKENLKGKTLVQRTSAGTQGALRSLSSKKLLVASFAVAAATINRISYLAPKSLTFLITSRNMGEEDVALADYMTDALLKRPANVDPYLEKVKNSTAANRLINPELPHCSLEDLNAVLSVDSCDFSMEIFLEDFLPVVYPTNFDGSFWKTF